VGAGVFGYRFMSEMDSRLRYLRLSRKLLQARAKARLWTRRERQYAKAVNLARTERSREVVRRLRASDAQAKFDALTALFS